MDAAGECLLYYEIRRNVYVIVYGSQLLELGVVPAIVIDAKSTEANGLQKF
jgi:hypothetical protein